LAGVASSFHAAVGGLKPEFAAGAEKASVRTLLPDRSTSRLHLEDEGSDVSVDVLLNDTRDVAAEVADGVAVYANAHDSGATLLHRPTPDGVEDFLSFETRPTSPEVSYDLQLGLKSAGLRLVDGTVEIVDDSGAPRLRVSPPYVIGADGVRTDAALAIEGCAVDTNPAAPWGRSITPPGALNCTVRVTWDDEKVAYPAILDPSWSSTGSMGTARQEHVMILLSTGKMLVAGGRSSNTSTAALATAELFDPATRTWGSTGSMAGARRIHRAVQLGSTSNPTTSGKVLVVGGINGTTSLSSAELYSPTAGTWTGAAGLPSARHDGTAILLASGQVLVAGGLSGTTVLNTALRYNPASGTGTWTAVANMSTPRRSHTATLLVVPGNSTLNNKVLVVGGNSGTGSLTSVQLFDGTSAWTTLTALSTAREGQTATALATGNVLLTGGVNGSTTLATTLLFNAASGSGSFASAGPLTSPRSSHTATRLAVNVLSSGQVLVSGGSNGTSALATSELWDGASTWTSTTALPAAVQGHTAGLLANSSLLIAGGISGSTVQNAARIYDPSVGLACMNDGQCASGHCIDGVCCATTCAGACMACNVAGSVGTCSPKLAGTTCTNGETCQGGSQAGTCGGGTAVVCPGADQCHDAAVCVPATGCPAPIVKLDGTSCSDGHACTLNDVCQAGTCQGSSTNACTAPVMDFDTLGTWSFSVPNGAVVGLNSNHTQGASSLEVAPHGYATLVSTAQSSLGDVGPLVLLDILLPTQQTNPFWYGAVQMFVSAPSLGIYNAYLGQVELTGLPLNKWQTIAFQLTPTMAAQLSGTYSDLTFTIALNVPDSQTASYLLDNLRPVSDVIPTLFGIATNTAGVTKAVFQYTTSNVTSIDIPYGPSNSLSNESGFIANPPEMPPQVFVSQQHSPFAATLGTQLTWAVGSHSVTATTSSPQLPATTATDGSRLVTLPDGSKFNIDAAPPKNPTPADGPPVGDPFNGALTGTLAVSPTGASTYTVPIAMPPAVAGIAPNLSLVYNSQGGDGIAGQGWEIGGLSVIHRCPKTKAVDGANRPIMMDDLGSTNESETDGICLDGQHLFEEPAGSGHYRAERATFGTIERLSDGSFRVTTKTGEIHDYGSALSSRVTLDVTPPGGQQPVLETAIWGLDRATDVWGNFYDVLYNNGDQHAFTTEGFKVTAIHYTGHNGDTALPPNTITFSYDPTGRPDVRWIRFADTRIPKNRRLTSITTPRGLYTLTYDTDSSPLLPSILKRIDYAAQGKSLKALEFDWKKGGYSWQERPAFALPGGFPIETKLKGVAFIDLDGDGRGELILARDGSDTAAPAIGTWRNGGAGWEQPAKVTWALPTFLSGPDGNPTGVRFADVDGDGFADIIQDHADIQCTQSGCFSCSHQPGSSCPGPTTPVSPAVWLNRLAPARGNK
jgi:hypothetical protein